MYTLPTGTPRAAQYLPAIRVRRKMNVFGASESDVVVWVTIGQSEDYDTVQVPLPKEGLAVSMAHELAGHLRFDQLTPYRDLFIGGYYGVMQVTERSVNSSRVIGDVEIHATFDILGKQH